MSEEELEKMELNEPGMHTVEYLTLGNMKSCSSDLFQAYNTELLVSLWVGS